VAGGSAAGAKAGQRIRNPVVFGRWNRLLGDDPLDEGEEGTDGGTTIGRSKAEERCSRFLDLHLTAV